MNENQREIAELMVSANALVGNLGNALTSAKDKRRGGRHNAEVREMDRIGKCVTDGMLEETCREMARPSSLNGFEAKPADGIHERTKEMKSNFPWWIDSSEPEYYPGIQRDGAIRQWYRVHR